MHFGSVGSRTVQRVLRYWFAALVLIAPIGSHAQVVTADVADLFCLRDNWVESMLATRANIANKNLGAADARDQPVTFGPWYMTGPHAIDAFRQPLFPEKAVNLTARSPAGKRLWRKRLGFVDGRVHRLPAGGRSATYLFRTITSASRTTLPVGLGSDDGLIVLLNGKEVLVRDVRRGVAANQDRTELRLNKGENQLLLKVYNNGGSHGFFFAHGEQATAADPPVVAAWRQMEANFPLQASWVKDHGGGETLAWFERTDDTTVEQAMIARAIKALGRDGAFYQGQLDRLVAAKTAPNDPAWLNLFEEACRLRGRSKALREINTRALRLAIDDLIDTHGSRYARGQEYRKRIGDFEAELKTIDRMPLTDRRDLSKRTQGLLEKYRKLQTEVLLANPLLDFGKLLLVKRKPDRMGLPQNWQGNCAVPSTGYDNEIMALSKVHPEGTLTTVFRPEKGEFVGDVDLHFDADRMLFSMPGSHGRWQIWEIGPDGRNLRQVTPGEYPDVDNYDACYLPDGRIIFDSTRCFQGVPCVGGGNTVANLFTMKDDGKDIRQLCFDQDHDWCPTVLNDGRVLYSRWEYSDTPHYFTRLLFSMNPDGTNQAEYYASNSFWPNSIFYARPIPNDPTKVVAVISGHHGVPRMGELVLFDPAKGRREANGAVQRIPGYRQSVEPKIADGLVNDSWPKFLHPYPLSDKYFLVASQPTSSSNWGIYLIDTFDNMVLIKEVPGYALLEPVALRKTKRPPIIPSKVDPTKTDALVQLTDVYLGDGLKGVPRGTVKRLRVYELHYAYPGMGGHIHIGIDGPWDARRILGTVPVHRDGSASFKIPANTPVAVQPLDDKGRAIQVMRSWFVAMPGENISCVGCHESQNTSPPLRQTLAALQTPAEIEPWYGPARSFSFKREVQPVLDEFCIGCHSSEGAAKPDLTVAGRPRFQNFTPSYVALHPYVRRPGPESDYHLQQPLEWHASTSELVQILERGHHNVELDDEAWDRLYTWIDLNVPDHGTWSEQRNGERSRWVDRRIEMRTKYANVSIDPEIIPAKQATPPEFAAPQTVERLPLDVRADHWPFGTAEARRRQEAAAVLEWPVEWHIELAGGQPLEMVLIPAGEFVMGSNSGAADEYPPAPVRVDKPFYMSKFEITNAQYALFDASHDSAYISVTNKDQTDRGVAVNGGTQPVIRVTWQRATEFCQWLSDRTGRPFTLPTEVQWEWACRAGTATPMYYGDCGEDFGAWANLADARVNNLCRRNSPKWIPSVPQVNDGAVVSQRVGPYAPNAFGLYDMHGNVAEWTLSAYRPYPYDTRDGRDSTSLTGLKVARGGSWYDRPQRARSAARSPYQAWQPVFNVGLRVIADVQ